MTNLPLQTTNNSQQTIHNKLQTIPELMAPAGDWTILVAAVNAGANAVYFGVEKLNMRAKAANFSTD